MSYAIVGFGKIGKLSEGGALVHARGRTWGRLLFQDLFRNRQ